MQNQRKYENQGKIKELKIGERIYRGTEDVVKGVVEKMSKELEPHNMDPIDGDPTPAELQFLSKLGRIDLSEEEEMDLLKPTEADEIEYILKHEVDLDSAPGEDGITYRFILLLWKRVHSCLGIAGLCQAGGNVAAFPEKMAVRMRALGAVFRTSLSSKQVLSRKTNLFRSSYIILLYLCHLLFSFKLRSISIYKRILK